MQFFFIEIFYINTERKNITNKIKQKEGQEWQEY